MEAITINVNKQMDGYTFSIAPSIRQMIKGWFPDAHPANNIFVAYDTKSNFEAYYGTLESHIYPALLGVDSNTDLRKKRWMRFCSLILKQVKCCIDIK
jgi:hypothetical protein